MSARRVRWECPNGCAAVLASTRPRRDDVARFCLACSAKSGRLVQRSAPALERQRSERRARTKEQAAAKREREVSRAAARFCVGGLDLVAALYQAWSLPISREWRETRRLPSQVPGLHVRRVAMLVGSYGYAWPWQHRMVVKVCEGNARSELTVEREKLRALGTLLHELAHILMRGSTERSHGPSFRVCLARLHAEWDERAPRLGFPLVGPVRDRYALNAASSQPDEDEDGDEIGAENPEGS